MLNFVLFGMTYSPQICWFFVSIFAISHFYEIPITKVYLVLKQ